MKKISTIFMCLAIAFISLFGTTVYAYDTAPKSISIGASSYSTDVKINDRTNSYDVVPERPPETVQYKRQGYWEYVQFIGYALIAVTLISFI